MPGRASPPHSIEAIQREYPEENADDFKQQNSGEPDEWLHSKVTELT